MNAFARLLLCTALSGLALGAQARTFEVSDFAELDNAVIEAEDGDEIVIKKGVYELEAPLEIFSRVTVRGEQGAVIDAGGRGSGFIVRVPKVRIENLTVRNYGGDLYARDAGVMVGDGADGTELVNLTLQGPGFGVRADRMNALVVEGCTIEGDADRHVLDRGDGIFLSYVKNARLNHNSLRNVRDGYYLENVDAAKSDFNYFTGAQYGIHYMYTRDCTATGNRAVGVRGGYALMSSDRVTLTKSYSSRNIEFGILLNVADGCLVEENTVEGVHNSKGRAALDNEGKGIFIYGPGKSRVTRNWIAATSASASPWAARATSSGTTPSSTIRSRSATWARRRSSGASRVAATTGARTSVGTSTMTASPTAPISPTTASTASSGSIPRPAS